MLLKVCGCFVRFFVVVVEELKETVGVILVCGFLKMSLCVTLLFGEQQLWHT